MIDIFGPQTGRLLRLISELSDLRAEDVEAVARAWSSTPVQERASAWAAIQQSTDARKRIAIQNAALMARHQALIVAQARGLRETGFWSAAWDAAGAVAAAPVNGEARAYRVLTSPMAVTLPWLSEADEASGIPQQRNGTERGSWHEPVHTPRGGRG